ncbi:hypothetical protein [Streptomyces chrestomyceticus]|uniref:hypothetical protein n=1 Tax=Streptomyces chrestomyceticus TaxID=68185 RepID=UPI0004C92810
MRITRRLIVTGTVFAACAATAVTVAQATGNPATATATVADAEPGSAVEDFSYPNADKIKKERGIDLKRGDGHIMLVDCNNDGRLMTIWSRTVGQVCFRVTGDTGYLSLSIPKVYGVKADADHKANMTLITDGSKQNIALGKNETGSAGETSDPERRPHDLIEISTSK